MPEADEKRYKYEKYLEEHKLLIDAEREAARSFDKSILTLAAGALGLSITFVREIAPHPNEVHWLYIAWAGFISSLLFTLTSFLVGQEAMRKQRDIDDERYRTDEESQAPMKNRWADWTNTLNYLAIVAFIIGVIFIALFAATNLK